jgi:asparagine synthase (glutamine-hydrolysing)
MARNYVKVLLSGEGGDEAFAGYSNYRNIVWLERFKRAVGPFNGAAAWGLSVADSWLDMPRVAKYLPLMTHTFPDYYYSRTSNPYRYAGNGLGTLYCSDFSSSIDRDRTIEPIRRLFARVKDEGVLDQMLYIDTKTWLPDDLLVKADKMTMANSLELRVPLLDHKVLEFAASLPSHYKLKGFATKHILKEALSKRVPKAILERKKTGFPVPYESWLRNDFKDFTHSILTDRAAKERGYFDKIAIEKLLECNHEQGKYSKEVFSLLTLELWHRSFFDGRGGSLN